MITRVGWLLLGMLCGGYLMGVDYPVAGAPIYCVVSKYAIQKCRTARWGKKCALQYTGKPAFAREYQRGRKYVNESVDFVGFVNPGEYSDAGVASRVMTGIGI